MVAYTGGLWRYDPPAVASVAPAVLPPNPSGSYASGPGSLIIAGTNFGRWAGVVSVGSRAVMCATWTDDTIACVAPPGVAAASAVVVTSSNNQSSPLDVARCAVHYLPPAISDVFVNTSGGNSVAATLTAFSGTLGGAVLYITGSALAALPPLSLSLWLARGTGSPAPPWRDVPAPAASAVVRCPLVIGSSTSASCTVPGGSGTGWRVIAVNHDGSQSWRASSPTQAQLSYRAPAIMDAWAVASSTGTGRGQAAAAGGFLLRVSGSDFSTTAPAVMVGGLPCPVVGPLPPAHDTILCEAPPRQVDRDNAVVVTVDGQSSDPLPFVYAPPGISAVEPEEVDAVAVAASGAAASNRVTIRGANFGVRYRGGMTTNHSVAFGGLPCLNVAWVSDSTLTCIPPSGVPVGTYSAVVDVAGSVSLGHPVAFSCPAGYFGQSGEQCEVCPQGAVCPGRGFEPLAAPGYYPRARTYYAPCVPAEACAGGVSAAVIDAGIAASVSAPCARFYKGVGCAVCAGGAYRRRERCVACPSTEWQLYLACGLTFVVLVAGAVYVRKKRISLAGLSVGVVRASRCTRVR